MQKNPPELLGVLRRHMIKMPECTRNASGIKIFGKLIKSIAFTTDVAVIKNMNADAVIAVYPFTPQPSITQAILTAADVPVFSGVGGGITTGQRVVNLSLDAEFRGAIGVVVNAPTPNETIIEMKRIIDIPVVVTVVSEKTDFKDRIEAGTDIFNVAGASNTVNIVKRIRDLYPEIPIIATGGPTEESINSVIDAGANAVTITPPTPAQLFKTIMENYRNQI